MDDTLAQVRSAYDRDPELEWNRLDSGAQGQLEFLVTSYALQRNLPTPARECRVLDAGVGPARYSILLARWGYRVTLLDLSPRLLKLARRRIAEADLDQPKRVEAIVEGSITDLSQFPDNHFDAVLCLGGPLSHVVDPLQRRQAVSELARVARPEAPVIISVMNRIGVLRAMVQWNFSVEDVQRFWENGLWKMGVHAAPAYFFTPDDFRDLLTGCGLTVERIYGTNGIGAHLQEENLTALMADSDRWPAWRDILLTTCDHPTVVGVSRHLLAVGRCSAQANINVPG